MAMNKRSSLLRKIAFLWLGRGVMFVTIFAPSSASAQSCTGTVSEGCLHPGAVCKPVTVGTGQSGHCKTGGLSGVGKFDCRCEGTPIPLGPVFDKGCSDRHATGKFTCTIVQPVVIQPETEYPNVVFAPGDYVDVQANGCVQTGGSGKTWKRYVNPDFDLQPNSTMYHGLISIPGTRDAGSLVPIRSVTNRFLQVTGEGAPLSQLYLHLGYGDTIYSDNSYDRHDDGSDDQCKTDISDPVTGGPAYVVITIYRSVPLDALSSPYDFDVVPNCGTLGNVHSGPAPPCTTAGLDSNGLLYNPLWAFQLRHGAQTIPETLSCHNFSQQGAPDFAVSPFPLAAPDVHDCTDQADSSTIDVPNNNYPDRFVCEWGEIISGVQSFSGHVNWFPVTMEGSIGWGGHQTDDDYDFTFTSDDPLNPFPLSVNGRKNLHVEFNSGETMDYFQQPEWLYLKRAVDASDLALNEYADCESAANTPNSPQCTQAELKQLEATIAVPYTYFDGHTAKGGHTILTGMFGLDGEHLLKAELHPLLAMATRSDTIDNGPSDEAWLMFVRNQGTEGECSESIWYAGFEDYTFRLPWRTGMTTVDVNQSESTFEVPAPESSGPTVAFVRPPSPDAGVYVTFHLGVPFENSVVYPYIDGVLHLIWGSAKSLPGNGSNSFNMPVHAAHSKPSPAGSPAKDVKGNGNENDEVEQMIETALRKLPSNQRLEVMKARALAPPHLVESHISSGTGPVQELKHAPVQDKKIVAVRYATKAGPATDKIARDAAQMRALCAVTENAPPGLPPIVCNKNMLNDAPAPTKPPDVKMPVHK
jgi:hypothetical protein